MKTINVRVPESLANWLSKEAAELGRSQSELVREALEWRRAGNFKSVGEMMEQLGGTFKGPRDLSTNKKYLEGYGR